MELRPGSRLHLSSSPTAEEVIERFIDKQIRSEQAVVELFKKMLPHEQEALIRQWKRRMPPYGHERKIYLALMERYEVSHQKEHPSGPINGLFELSLRSGVLYNESNTEDAEGGGKTHGEFELGFRFYTGRGSYSLAIAAMVGIEEDIKPANRDKSIVPRGGIKITPFSWERQLNERFHLGLDTFFAYQTVEEIDFEVHPLGVTVRLQFKPAANHGFKIGLLVDAALALFLDDRRELAATFLVGTAILVSHNFGP